MKEVVFLGEHLIYGNLGHLAVVMAFSTSIISAIAYFYATRNPEEKSWKKIADTVFYAHTFFVLAIVGLLFFIIHQHLFEYHYAWQHSSRELPVQYMISCFWEGQEGSFLLWIFWQMVIGNILLRTAGMWKSPTMAVLMLSQIALTSMLIGIKIFGYKLGSSPFELLRNAVDAPIFRRANYLELIKDGNGLNPLLQNYWMVIHPPTLFFGFATTIVPFAFAIAGLWKRDYSGWIKPALPWGLVSVMVLGTGIIMGGFWAYESLSFGGYWAWDPVENASLIPWLILIAGVHVVLIYKHTGNSLSVGFILIISAFLLVLYATFLTRSGILGNSSVHSFTDLGMSGQLLVFLFMFIILAVGLMISRWKEIPKSTKDEEVYTREFWMFIGSLVLVISAFQVILTTSIPVFNKIFSTNIAPPADIINHYNKWQMPMAIIVGLLTGVAHLIKYKKNKAEGLRKMILWGCIALATSIGLMFAFSLTNWFYIGLLFAGVFTIFANASLLKPMFTGKVQLAGASVAHIGFGILLIGVLVSSANKQVISINQSGMQLNPEFDAKDNMEHVYLEKGKALRMGDYEIEYRNDSSEWVNNYYQVHYKKINPKTNEVEYEFDLYPNAQINPKMGLVANPDTKHYISHDVFTFVSSVPKEKEDAKFVNPKSYDIAVGDTIITDHGYVVLEKINSNAKNADVEKDNMQLLIAAELKIHTLDKTYEASPMYGIQNNSVAQFDAVVDEANMRFKFTNVNPQNGKITIEVAEKDTSGEFIIMKAIMFPWINLVWAGTIIMVIGFTLAIIRRIQEFRRVKGGKLPVATDEEEHKAA
jgi:cytochrome c-type biogenesis protein CcmF